MSDCVEDKDMWNMADEELAQALVEERRLQHLLLKSLLPKDDADERDCILEVRAGNMALILFLPVCAPCNSLVLKFIYAFPLG